MVPIAGASQARVLDAAEACFRELGLEAASVEAIARRAGVTRKTVYNHFPNKTAIGLALIARAEADDGAYRAQIAANLDARSLLEQALLDSAGWCRANPAVAALALAPASRPALEPPHGRPSFQRLVRDILALGQAQGSVRRDEAAEFLALFVLGIYGQFMLSALATGGFDPADVRRIVRLAFEGMSASPRGVMARKTR